MFDSLQKKYATTFLKPYLTWYLKKERTTKVRGFHLLIKPTVFHPKYFFSSIYLFDFVSQLNLANSKFLEIGSGSGLISLLAYKKKALVTCCDINSIAIECTKQNFSKNFNKQPIGFSVYQSDLFDAIPVTRFDTIVINPPYFFDEINSQDQLAWNCGKNGEYFNKLFSGLDGYIHPETNIFMVLADNCELDRIRGIAVSHNFSLELIEQKKIKWELNYIFKITAI